MRESGSRSPKRPLTPISGKRSYSETLLIKLTNIKNEIMARETLIDVASNAAGYPLSPMQEGMLFHNLRARQPGVDILQIICDWHKDIDAPVFNQAWQHVMDRHSVLRTSFTWEGLASPRQRVHETLEFSVQQQDWQGLSPQAQEQRLEEFLQADQQISFPLTIPPLMRVTLIRLAPAQCRFVWTIHHLLVDSRSFVIVLNDLFLIYQTLQSGQELLLKPTPNYREYIE